MKINTSGLSYINTQAARLNKTATETSSATVGEAKQTFMPNKSTEPGGKSAAVGKGSQAAPVEAYAIPDWMKGYGRDISREMVLGQSATYRDPENIRFENASQEELAEFSELSQKHLYQLYENNGLLDVGARYKATTSIQGLSERLREEFNASVKSDSRMMALMDKLGLKITSFIVNQTEG